MTWRLASGDLCMHEGPPPCQGGEGGKPAQALWLYQVGGKPYRCCDRHRPQPMAAAAAGIYPNRRTHRMEMLGDGGRVATLIDGEPVAGSDPELLELLERIDDDDDGLETFDVTIPLNSPRCSVCHAITVDLDGKPQPCHQHPDAPLTSGG